MATTQTTDVTAAIMKARPRARLTREKLAGFARRVREISERSSAWLDSRLTQTIATEAEQSDLADDLRRCDVELSLAGQWLHELHEELEQMRVLLERVQAQYLEIFANAPEAYVMTDARGVICDANPAAATLLEMEPSVLTGKLLISFVARGDTRAFRAALHRLKEAAPPRTLSLHLRPRGKRPFPVSLSIGTIHDAHGQTIGHRWTLRRE